MKLALIFRAMKDNRYSISALIAAIESKLRGVKVLCAKNIEEIIGSLDFLSRKGYKVVISYSILTTQLPQLLDEMNALEKIKNTYKDAIFIAGGPHPSGDPVGTLNLGFDYVFVGEAEDNVIDFIESLIDGKDPLSSVRGLMVKDGDSYIFTGRPKYVDLDLYPPFPYWRGMFSPIEITRGCPFACRYCQVSVMHGAKPRHRSLENVLKYSEIMLKSGRKDLRFISPNSFSYLGNGRRINLDGLCSLVRGLEILTKEYKGRFFLGTFPSEVRPEHAKIEEAVRCIAGKVANKRVIIGAQSGSEDILKKINRGHGIEDVIEAVEVLNKYGFTVDIDFILGLPLEEPEDMEESVRFMEFLTSKFKARIHIHYYLPLPGSPFDMAKPKPIPQPLRKKLFKLLGKGKIYGDWFKQEKLSESITDLWRKGIILGFKGWKYVKFLRKS